MDEKWRFIVVVLVIFAVASWFLASIISGYNGVEQPSEGNVAVIYIDGPITVGESSSFFETVASSGEIIDSIQKADKNPGIKAILIVINSGGGSPVGSAEIADAVKNTEKPTVALIEEIGASGAYWAASAADVIVAHEFSFVGSIGVIGSYLEFADLMERYGVTYRRLVAGEYKDIGSPFKEMTPAEEALLQNQLNLMRDYFLIQIAENRNLTQEQLNEVSSAAVYIGLQARGLNLIDYFGGKEEALGLIEEELGIEARPVDYKKKKTVWDMLSQVFSKQSYSVGQGIGDSIMSKTNDLRVFS